MPAAPWKSLRAADPTREYLALLSFLPLKGFWDLWPFARGTLGVMKQLSAAPGLIGYTLLARPFAKNFWTLSAWEDEAALKAFVRHPPHVRIMVSLAPHMRQTKFVQWSVKGAELPLRWDDALRRAAHP